jgi:hypothetical protein
MVVASPISQKSKHDSIDDADYSSDEEMKGKKLHIKVKD